jgi:hypothetical protein
VLRPKVPEETRDSGISVDASLRAARASAARTVAKLALTGTVSRVINQPHSMTVASATDAIVPSRLQA